MSPQAAIIHSFSGLDLGQTTGKEVMKMLKPLRRALWLLLTMVDPNWWERELKGEPIPEGSALAKVTLRTSLGYKASMH